MKRQYFYASLFVRVAKGLAVLTGLIGIGFCALRYYQASITAGAVAYQPSADLQQLLNRLKDAFLTAEQTANLFNEGNQSTAPSVDAPHFPLVIDSTDDFNRIAAELARVDQVRRQLKESIVSRFETLVKSIEDKLHAYAAVLQSSPSPTPATSESLNPNASPSPSPTAGEESLFSSQLATSEANERRADLNERKEFLKALADKAENAENRVILREAAGQLDRLAKLLPEKFDASTAAQPGTPSIAGKEPPTEQGDKVLPSERVARQLEQLRGAVRRMLLTSWSLDDAFKQVVNANLAEQEKYRAATVAQKAIWLAATSRIIIGLLAVGLASLVIVVFADLVQTQLDTATNSSTVADAIDSLRGSVTHLSAAEPALEEAAAQVHKNGEKRSREDSNH
jgi:hypothetical protein